MPFTNIKPDDYTYDLPDERIALYPVQDRDESLLLVRKTDRSLGHDRFRNLAGYLKPGTHLFFNDSRVIPARLIFTGSGGSRIELFCLRPADPPGYEQSLSSVSTCVWECMTGNRKKFREDTLEMEITAGGKKLLLRAEKAGQPGNSSLIRFSWDDDRITFTSILSAAGRTPLPPYIKREAEEHDRQRYQTVYARYDGSVAAPTAGLHFTDHVMQAIRQKGISTHEVTLHVGAGTFLPVRSGNLAGHPMHAESFRVPRSVITLLAGLAEPVTAVGTTTVRTLESLYWLGVKILSGVTFEADTATLGQWEAYGSDRHISTRESFLALDSWMERKGVNDLDASTRLMIVPGYRFRVVNTLVTNFHQPGSTLLLLVAAFIGDSWKTAYRYALDHGFRFLSYGDSSLMFRDDVSDRP